MEFASMKLYWLLQLLYNPHMTYLYLFPITTGTVASTLRRMNECQTQTIKVTDTVTLCNFFYCSSNWVLSLCWTSFLNTFMMSKYTNNGTEQQVRYFTECYGLWSGNVQTQILVLHVKFK
jgi:hypothetical protein